jgi:hypothetical protein
MMRTWQNAQNPVCKNSERERGVMHAYSHNTTVHTTAPVDAVQYHAQRNALLEQAEQLASLERELNHFLDHYMQAVADDMATLASLQRAKTEWFSDHLPQAHQMAHSKEHEDFSARNQLARDVYRKAARNTHPDITDSLATHDTTSIQRINQARDEGDIATLLDAALPPTPDAPHIWDNAMYELEHWQARLNKSRNALLDSPGYALYLKAMEARLAGRDWLNDVTQKIRQNIAHETRAIAKQGVRAIANWRVA